MAIIFKWLISAWFGIVALLMFFQPMVWYQITPGVAETGPFNMHFVMDIGLIFFVSAAAFTYGITRRVATALIFGALWPFLHALFHIFIWFQRGMLFDVIALSNLLAIQLPAWAALYFALQVKKELANV